MKYLLFIVFTIIIILSLSVAGGIYFGPSYLYNKVVNQSMKTSWYFLDQYRPLYLTPSKEIEFKSPKKANESFWKKFHFDDLNIPLPVKNPFFFVVPKLTYNERSLKTKFSISILDAGSNNIADIHILQSIPFPNYTSSQRFFELPLVRKEIDLKSSDEIWRDVFSKDISSRDIPLEEMLYNLYLLQFRSKIISQGARSFGFLKGKNIASIALDYDNKDYQSELVMKKRGEEIFSFIIVTRKNSSEAQLVRRKMIDDSSYAPSSPSLSSILLKEFKALKYADQTDHEGMLYLLSAWSHEKSVVALLEKTIFYLERGFKNQRQLEVLYKYYYKRYGEIYSERNVENIQLEKELLLERKIKDEKLKDLEEEVIDDSTHPKATLREEFENIIEKTNVNQSRESKTIRID